MKPGVCLMPRSSAVIIPSCLDGNILCNTDHAQIDRAAADCAIFDILLLFFAAVDENFNALTTVGAADKSRCQ